MLRELHANLSTMAFCYWEKHGYRCEGPPREEDNMSVNSFQPTSVNSSGLTALIQNLGRDCSPTQFIREFVQNGIEACLRNKSGKVKKVVIDYNERIYKKAEVFKISFMDTGDGMTPDQMITLLNNLSSSGTSSTLNYGVGAKISALTRNHAGILYQSWRSGQGNQMVISFNEEKGIYGINGYDHEGSFHLVTPIRPHDKPKEIDESGTVVTLLGMTQEQDTMAPIPGIGGSKEAWITYYLNSRYFCFPSGIEIWSRTGYDRIGDPKHNHLTRIKGQKQVLDDNCECKGEMQLADAKAYWWILNKGLKGHGRENLRGHTALINQNEILDISDNRSSRLTYFGIYTGKDRVVIYIEPENAVQNTARTNLLKKDGSPIEWSSWQDEFRENIPSELKKYIEKILSETAGVSHLDKIEERLKEYSSLYKLGRYKPSAKGVFKANPETQYEQLFDSGSENQFTNDELNLFSYSSKNKNSNEGKPKSSGSSFSSKLLSELVDQEQLGVNATRVNVTPYPDVHWVKESENENLVDRAAEYDYTTNKLLINLDFQGIKDVLEYWQKRFLENNESQQLIKETVTEAFEQTLLECVVGALSFKNRKHWNHDEFLNAVSKEALSTAVMQRYWMMTQIKRSLHSKIKALEIKENLEIEETN